MVGFKFFLLRVGTARVLIQVIVLHVLPLQVTLAIHDRRRLHAALLREILNLTEGRLATLGHILGQLVNRLAPADHDLRHRLANLETALEGRLRSVLRRGAINRARLVFVAEQDEVFISDDAWPIILRRRHHLDAPVVGLLLDAVDL